MLMASFSKKLYIYYDGKLVVLFTGTSREKGESR